MEIREQEIRALMGRHLSPEIRYRSVIMESNNWQTLEALGNCFRYIYPDAEFLTEDDFFDDDGVAISASVAVAKIKEKAKLGLLVIEGTFHACDTWCESQQRIIWQDLAAYAGGEGIVILDRKRQRGTRLLFGIVEHMKSADVIVLKSRLALKESK